MLRTLAFVALRLLVLAGCVGALTLGVVAVGERVLPKPVSSSDWGFGRLGIEMAVGVAAGLALGLVLASRLGRSRFDGPTRVLQTLAALALPVLLMLAQCMEGSSQPSL